MPSQIHAHREIFSKSYQIKPKSDCIYHFPIDLEQQTNSVRFLCQINLKTIITVKFRLDLIRFREKKFCVKRECGTPDTPRVSCQYGADGFKCWSPLCWESSVSWTVDEENSSPVYIGSYLLLFFPVLPYCQIGIFFTSAPPLST